MNPAVKPILLDLPAEIQGDRVRLRRLCDADAPALWEAVDGSRQHLKRWMPWVDDHNCLDFSREYVRRMQARWALREDLPMAIWRVGDGRLLGATGLHRIDWSVPAMEIGYWLRLDAQGSGYATDAARQMTAFAFRHACAERVEIRCDAANHRSAAVPRRLGYIHEATLRAARRSVDGTLGDTLLFAMTRADFDRLKP